MKSIRRGHIGFDFVDLTLFIHVAESRSVTGGAAKLRMSIPAASTRLKGLEDALGSQLLHRSHNGVSLTQSGEAFLHHARLILLQLDNLHTDLDDYSAKGLKGVVRVSANMTVATEFLPSVVSRFLLSHPDVNVDLTERLSTATIKAVIDGTADIGIISENVHSDNLAIFPYRTEKWVLIAAPGHPLSEKHRVAIGDVLNFALVGLPDTSGQHMALVKLAETRQISMKRRIQASNFGVLCKLVEENVGVGFIPESSVSRYAHMALKVVQLEEDWIQEFKICVRSLRLLPPFSKDLLDMLISNS